MSNETMKRMDLSGGNLGSEGVLPKALGHDKTVGDIVVWLQEHGINRSTANSIYGFLKAYDIELPPFELCMYGMTYDFNEFLGWFYSAKASTDVKVNDLCIFWDKGCRGKAIIAVLTEVTENCSYIPNVDCTPYEYCVKLDTLAQYRAILNTPDDIELEYEKKYEKPVPDEIIEVTEDSFNETCEVVE